MAQDDRPYGGRIKVLFDGSVAWDVRNRFFPTKRDTDGEIKYAIRVITAERNVVTSADGKCIVTVTDPARAATGHLAFLIVSGYDTLALPRDAIAVGKSYFITADWFPSDEQETRLPGYSVTLLFDDYDLEYADLSRDTDARALELCHLEYELVPGSSAHPGAPFGANGFTPTFPQPGASSPTTWLLQAIASDGKVNAWKVNWARIRDQGSAAIPAGLNLGPKIVGARSLVARGLSSPETVQLMSHGHDHNK